jgi:hypothetical protein
MIGIKFHAWKIILRNATILISLSTHDLSRNVLAAMQCYAEILKEKEIETSQTSLISSSGKRKALSHLTLNPLPRVSRQPKSSRE